jgi:hypothetical protein
MALKAFVSPFSCQSSQEETGKRKRTPVSLPVPRQVHRHRFPEHWRARARPILGGLHHDYQMEEAV